MANYSDDDCWSEETYTLAEVPDTVELPTLVRVIEGIYSTQDCSTFSQGDIIRIDGCETVEMVAAHLAILQHGCFKAEDKDLFVPLSYKGRVRVCSVHGSRLQYTSVDELIEYFPKFVKLNQSISFTDNKGQTFILQPNDTIELLKIIGSKATGAKALRVRQNNSEIILPRSLKGMFVDVDFTISDVMKLPMPQCIKFLGQDINQLTSKDIQEAAANIDQHEGYLILSGERKKRAVLVGHYKSLEKDQSSRFCRRSAVVLPMDNPDIASVQVQIPVYMDTADYQIFALKHFSEKDVSQSVEGLLYVEFSKNPTVTFLKDPNSCPPVVPPRLASRTAQQNDQVPPRPPKLGKSPQHQNEPAQTELKQSAPLSFHTPPEKPALKQDVLATPKHGEAPDSDDGYEIPGNHHVRKPPTNTVAPFQRGKDAAGGCAPETGTAGKSPQGKHSVGKGATAASNDASHFVMADLFSSFGMENSDTADEYFEYSVAPITYENVADVHKKTSKGKTFLHKIKKKLAHKPHGDSKEEQTRTQMTEEGQEEADSAPVYDYVDETSLVSIHARYMTENKISGAQADGDTKGKTAVVQPFQQVDGQTQEKKFKYLSVDELQACFELCAMKRLAEIVGIHRLDGELFSCLSDDDLKKDPIFLNNLDIKKVRQIQKGWRPNVL